MATEGKNLRGLWKRYECRRDLMERISFGDDSLLVAPPTVPAWQALYEVMNAHDYWVRVDDTDSYNCRNIKGKTTKSLHSYGIALDVNWQSNPWRDHAGKRAVRYSPRDTQDERATDVKVGSADTDMTRAMIEAILEIRTQDGKQVFVWGGNWETVKDAMHFEIALSPVEIEAGVDWNTVASNHGGFSDHDLPDDAADDAADNDDNAEYEHNDDVDEDEDDLVLAMGATGPLVRAIQNSLTRLGYWLGKIDGIFGRMTRDALLSFQADNTVPLTGEYDLPTRAALEKAGPRPIDPGRINDTEDDLIARGSQTMNSARWNRWIGLGTIGLGVLGLSDKHTNFVQGAVNAVRGASGTIESAVEPKELVRSVLQKLAASPQNAGEAKIEDLATTITTAFENGAAVTTTTDTGGVWDSVLTLSQGVLSSSGFGVWPLIAGAGFAMWRNANKAGQSRLSDHRTGANRGH